MQITHEEARRLIQFDSDDGLNTHQKRMLDAHLEACVACRNYADSIRNMESVLRPLLQRQWNQQLIPFPVSRLVARENSRITGSMILATRIAAVSFVFLAFLVSAWQFALSGWTTPTPRVQGIPNIPTPSTSTLLTSTELGFGNCTAVTYIVQKNDTLASIAYQFSISKEEIMQANTMKTEAIRIGQELSLPVCDSTPTGTVRALTTTFTPILNPTTSTPGG